MDKYEKFLPVGSVVLLNEATKRVMITGFYIKGNEIPDKVFDYIGCLYPEGVISTDKNLLFNHEDIKQIYAIGYSDDEEKKFKEKLKDLIEKQGEV